MEPTGTKSLSVPATPSPHNRTSSFCSPAKWGKAHITPVFSALSHLTDGANRGWEGSCGWAEKGHVGEQRSPVLAWFFGYSPRHPSRRFSTWGNDCRLLGWDLPEASVLSIGPHSLYPLPRVSNSKPFSLEELGLWPRLVTILSLKRFPHPKRCQSSILAEP